MFVGSNRFIPAKSKENAAATNARNNAPTLASANRRHDKDPKRVHAYVQRPTEYRSMRIMRAAIISLME
jgi:hypothetical protein